MGEEDELESVGVARHFGAAAMSSLPRPGSPEELKLIRMVGLRIDLHQDVCAEVRAARMAAHAYYEKFVKRPSLAAFAQSVRVESNEQ